MRNLVILLAWGLANLAAGNEPTYTMIPHPNPDPPRNAAFGEATAILDYNGDGKADMAVSAPGEGKIYLFFGPAFKRHRVLQPDIRQRGDRFGKALAVGQFDKDPGDELVVGASGRTVNGEAAAGAIFVMGRAMKSPLMLTASKPIGKEIFGTSLAVGDFDHDSLQEIAAGAPGSPTLKSPGGKVYLFDLARKDGNWEVKERVFANQQTSRSGNYGHDLATGDWDGNGMDDLFVSALGNNNKAGQDRRGQVFIFTGPIKAAGPPAKVVVLEDHLSRPKEGPTRWGMCIHARGGLFLLGSPRKDGRGKKDCGICYLFRKDQPPVALFSPKPMIDGILGYRVRLGDVVGDSEVDIILYSLPVGLFVLETKALDKPIFVPPPSRACPHWACGNTVGQLFPGGKEEILLGGPDWEPPGKPDNHDSGRVNILRFHE